MYACLECGKRLPPRASGGHRERQFCSDRCRQRAYRKDKKQELEIERIISGEYWFPPKDPKITRDRWRAEREGLLQRYKSLAAERNVLQARVSLYESVIDALEGRISGLEAHIQLVESAHADRLADKEAEIARLSVLLKSYEKRQRR